MRITPPSVNRVDPSGPSAAYRTYGAVVPRQTHTRAATCAEVECDAMAHGWITTVDVATPLGQRQANYIRLKSGRHFTATAMHNLVSFTFPAGQTCFAEHRVPLERPPVLYTRPGDWRSPDNFNTRRIVGPSQWTDTICESFDDFADRMKRG
jgi:hypothetical protein